tara:strand:+ start:1000 stop:1647 length:648 start_codon:yes stop_codon:yes gene_type:complete
MLKPSFLIFCGLFFLASGIHALPFQPRIGDLVLQNLSSNFASGVSGATNSPWAHVGIIDKYNDQLVVIEANFKGVIRTPLTVFLERCKRRYSVVRLSLPLSVISKILARANTHIGKTYDYLFRLDELDTLYCSELIYDSLNYVLKTDNPLSPKPMDFNGAMDYWTKYFKRHGSPVPQGEPGVSPHDVFKITGGRLIFHYDKSDQLFQKLYEVQPQ